jgi:hypothetical protein
MTHTIRSQKKRNTGGRDIKETRVFKIRGMIPKKLRETHDISIHGDEVHLVNKELRRKKEHDAHH